MRSLETTAATPLISERVALVCAGGAALAVYGATMFPGLAGIGDTPKWQFVGSVLGTPHSPGYPLYVLVSWLFAHLPLGTLAFRINLLSAVAGAAAVTLMTAALLELGCRPLIAAAGALAVGFGRVFWSQALLAEVYTLNATLFAGAVLFVLRWGRTKADRDLFMAGVFVALGGAHHPTAVMAFPAIAVYGLSVDAALAVRPRSLLTLLTIATGAASLYLLLWLRTVQHAAFIEVHPESFGELVAVVRGKQFAKFIAPYSWGQLIHERVPLIWHWLAAELHGPAVALAAIGTAAIIWRSWRQAVLLLGAAAAVLAFALDYDAYDIQVFLIIPMMIGGMLAAFGLEQLVREVEQRDAATPLAISLVAAGLSFALVAAQLRANGRANNQHDHRFEIAYFDALFAQLPERSAIVEESYTVDHMVLYELIGEHAARGRDVVPIRARSAEVERYVRGGYAVYAFAAGRQALARQGVFMDKSVLRLPLADRPRHIIDTEAVVLGSPLACLSARGPC